MRPAYLIALVAVPGAALSLTALWIASDRAADTQGLRAAAVDGELGIGLFLWLSGFPNPARGLLIVPVAVLPAGILYASLRRMERVAIGIERDRVTLVDMFGHRVTVKPEALVYSRNRLTAGNIAVPLRNNQGDLFDPDGIERHLLPLLKSDQRVREIAYLARRLRSGDPKSWLGLAALLIMLAAALWLEFAR